MSEPLNYNLAIVKQQNTTQGANNMKDYTINVGTDRNNGKPADIVKTAVDMSNWVNKHRLIRIDAKRVSSPPIGDWPAEDTWVLKFRGPNDIAPLLLELCDKTEQHAIAYYDHNSEVGDLAWSDSTPDSVERFQFDADYFHTV